MPPALFFGFTADRARSAAERAGRHRRLCLLEIHQHSGGGRLGNDLLDPPRGSKVQQMLIEFLDFHGFILDGANRD